MKRFFPICLAGLSMLMAGCQREGLDKSTGDCITASITVSLPGHQATRAISDGSQANELLFMAYDDQGNHLENLDQTVTVKNLKATVTARLVRGVSYQFVFWAQKSGQYTIREDDNGYPAITLSADQLSGMMNSDDFDAFFAHETSEPQYEDFEMDVTLLRPFAQLNVGANAADISAAQASDINLEKSFKTSFSIKGVCNALNLLTGDVSGDENVTYTATVAPADNIVSGQETFRRIAMVYVLAPDEAVNHDVTLNINTVQNNSNSPVNITHAIPNVPLKRNCRTNILGKVFSVDATINVTIDSNFNDGDQIVDLPTVVPGPTYTVSFDNPELDGHGLLSLEPGLDNAFKEGDRVTVIIVMMDAAWIIENIYYNEDGVDNCVPLSWDSDAHCYYFSMPANNVTIYNRVIPA